MSYIKKVGASDPPATFSYLELLKRVKKIDKNLTTSVDTKVALPHIEVQVLRGYATDPETLSNFLIQTVPVTAKFSLCTLRGLMRDRT
jgi:hypothetical protein